MISITSQWPMLASVALFACIVASSAFTAPRLPQKQPFGTTDSMVMSSSSSEQQAQESIDTAILRGIRLESASNSGQLAAYQILYPYMFSSLRSGEDIVRPLSVAMSILQKSLRRVEKTDMDLVLDYNTNLRVLRIEHTVSHSVDPLCWLHAQKPRHHSSIYFANANVTTEAAAFGAAYLHENAANDELWKFVGTLPRDSHLYGGQRFDLESAPDELWEGFGTGFWALPMVEVRRKKTKQGASKTTVAVHVHRRDGETWGKAARRTLEVLKLTTPDVSESRAPTDMPPVISRDGSYGPDLDAQEIYERGVMAALDEFDSNSALEKVVLARRSKLMFDKSAKLSALDVLQKWKFGGNEGGHLFYLRPGGSRVDQEFFGCTPEQLFLVGDGKVVTEALAGTRPRGSTQEADEALSRDLFESPKDRAENEITGRFVRNALLEASRKGLIELDDSLSHPNNTDRYFVRRLLHLQHICQRFECNVESEVSASSVARHLLGALHPTPAVCGFPVEDATRFIRSKESCAFDRGYYSGPFGLIGRDQVELVVALRSGVVTKDKTHPVRQTYLSLFAGAGIVPGSTVQGEWSETSYKLNVVSTLFAQSPITLSGAQTPNVGWATTFIEELIRSGVTQFYVCPGSRSTPLVAALAKAVRSQVGVVEATSVHDERAAAFRAVGYGKVRGRPAAVITSSGTATSNLYPGIVEAGIDGVPLLLITADRPYENRQTGANQAIDQVKSFSSSYVRWFRDIPPPTDDIPVSICLADANYAVHASIEYQGPVHLNIQFRENLAPDSGAIRNDDRPGSETRFDGNRFTDAPNFQRWSKSGRRWTTNFNGRSMLGISNDSISEISELLAASRRGMIVVGNLRANPTSTVSDQVAAIADFAEKIGFPVFAGVQGGNMRTQCPAVVKYAEHILKVPAVAENLCPDLILQFGHPLVSTEIPKLIRRATRAAETDESSPSISHILVHPHHPEERSDPELTITHRVSCDVNAWVTSTTQEIDLICDESGCCSSELSPIISLGRVLAQHITEIVETSSAEAVSSCSDAHDGHICSKLTEPQIVVALSDSMKTCAHPLFLSNSMPIRDAEFFLYPDIDSISSLSANRGASGIDGIVSSAMGFAEANRLPTTLLIGDLSAIHDLNSFHALSQSVSAAPKSTPPLTTIVVNNNGGGIFSFLPIAKHGENVNFEEFFGTPTESFSFEKGAAAFGLSFQTADSEQSFRKALDAAAQQGKSNILEANVVDRHVNVRVHELITTKIKDFVSKTIDDAIRDEKACRLPVKIFSSDGDDRNEKTMLLIHGWMGDKSECDELGLRLVQNLPPRWSIIAIDLHCHSEMSAELSSIRKVLHALRLRSDQSSCEGLDYIAELVLSSISKVQGVSHLDAIVGYSLGGRVALAMNKLCEGNFRCKGSRLISRDTKLVLLGSDPGNFPDMLGTIDSKLLRDQSVSQKQRLATDELVASKMRHLANRGDTVDSNLSARDTVWSDFLDSWYDAPIWGNIKERLPVKYREMVLRRSEKLSLTSREVADVLTNCSPGRTTRSDWGSNSPTNILFFAGDLDAKYTEIGKTWSKISSKVEFISVPKAGHALLIEAPEFVAERISNYLAGAQSQVRKEIPQEEENSKIVEQTRRDTTRRRPDDAKSQPSPTTEVVARPYPAALDFEPFSIDMSNGRQKGKGVVGIGWGKNAISNEGNRVQQRNGFIIQIMSQDGATVGVGEASPLGGLHVESLDEVRKELLSLNEKVSACITIPPIMDPRSLLAMQGGLSAYIDLLLGALQIDYLSPSTRAGLEMALISFASQLVRKPILNCLSEDSLQTSRSPGLLALNGLITRDTTPAFLSQAGTQGAISYSSLKVKVGYQSSDEDVRALSMALKEGGKLRLDANRGWDLGQAMKFSSSLESLQCVERIEFVEEPLKKVEGSWTFHDQLQALECWHQQSGIKYALDESLADLVEMNGDNFDLIHQELLDSFEGIHGCAAFVLKPAVLGLELSMRLAKLAHTQLKIGAVFSSSFDSGIGLSYTAFLATASDLASGLDRKELLAHGIGTFSLLEGDTLSPSFGSYVNENGMLQVSSLSRAFFGLGLDEMRRSFPTKLPKEDDLLLAQKGADYSATAATSSSGRDIRIVVSLPLPFSDEIACSRFTDLPQQSRWSPWLSSVAYLDTGKETEWTLNIRGVKFSWRAVSNILETPYKGIEWESISGLKNLGIVEFVPSSDDDGNNNSATCTMKVRMTLVAPRILATLFPGASVFVEDFLRNKLLKWSLEMFRDVVKGDLALERGDVELGDALFGAVEGKASAIEATLSPNPVSTDDSSDTS